MTYAIAELNNGSDVVVVPADLLFTGALKALDRANFLVHRRLHERQLPREFSWVDIEELELLGRLG